MHVQAPPSIVMIHSGVLLKIGAYGLIRFGLGLFASIQNGGDAVAVLGVINLLYGAFLAFISKRTLNWCSPIPLFPIWELCHNRLGCHECSRVSRGHFQVISHGLISALLFFLVGVIYERTETSLIPNLGGMAKGMPLVGGFLLAGRFGFAWPSGYVRLRQRIHGLPWPVPVDAGHCSWLVRSGLSLTARSVLGQFWHTFGKTHRDSGKARFKRNRIRPGRRAWVFLIVLIGVCPSVL